MDTRTIEVKPELSAQGIRKLPNPILVKLLPYLQEKSILPKSKAILVDQGCGQLRHAALLMQYSNKLICVDTKHQIETKHDFYGDKLSITDFVRKKWHTGKIEIISSDLFLSRNVKANVILSINVIDVLPPKERKLLFSAAYNNLSKNGYYIVIVPRNDSWTLRLCTPKNRFQDGFIFKHSKGYTFYKNWGEEEVIKKIEAEGFKLFENHTQYKYITLILRKT